jgi:signal transduction histidine kinase
MPQRASIRILMIDDDPDDVLLAGDVVRELASYRGALTSAPTFDAGLAALLGPTPPDVCLLDLRLGERTGIELLREARSAGCRVPIIVLTGAKSNELDVEILRAGGSDYVMKHELDGRALDRSIRYAIERARAVEEIARAELAAKARLLLADRRVAVGTLSAGVAHEINNPLAYVLSNIGFATEELARRARDPSFTDAFAGTLEPILEALKDAREGALRVDGVVKDLQTFSRDDETARASIDVNRAVKLAASLAENEVRHRARIILDHGNVPLVDANEGRLSQVLLNLLLNAAQAVGEGDAAANEIRVVTTHEDGHVVVRVIDSGTGIPANVLGRVFDPFFTTRAVDVGTGLGLFVSRNIVHALGGDILVESTVGTGTTVTVRLPALSVLTPASTYSSPPMSRRGRVLVIDDEPLVGTSLRRNLTKDHDVVALTSAREALGRIEAGERFDVILCDLMMPELTGMDFYDEIAKRFPALAPSIIFFTGGAFTPRASAFLETISNACLEKPAEMEQIRRLLRARIQP